MGIESLKQDASRIAYELRKNFPEEERPITHYICDNEVVVISTKKLYIFYYSTVIDYKNEYLSRIDIVTSDFNNNECCVILEGKKFSLKFASEVEFNSFIRYYKKYK